MKGGALFAVMLWRMTIRLGPLLIVLGMLLTVGGAVLGFSPISRVGVSCGSALTGNNNAAITADFTNALEADQGTATYAGMSVAENACTAARSDRKPIALATLMPGVLLLLVGAVVTAAGRAPAKT